MLVLKIILLTLLALVIITFVLTLLPISVAVKFKKSFGVRVYYCGFKIFSTHKPKKAQTESDETNEKKRKNLFKEVYKQKGLRGSVEYFSGLAAIILKKLTFVIRHISLKKLRFNLWVTGLDAAQTAVRYGEVCTALYPAFSLLSAVADCDIKRINVNADFNGKDNKVEFSFVIRSLPIFLIIAALGGFVEYKKYKGVN